MAELRVDVIHPDGRHDYWSTHCRHGGEMDDERHAACRATSINGGPRNPASCKVCRAPFRCWCHKELSAPTEQERP